MTSRGQRGFTLIEMLIVVAILAILAAILIPNFIRSRAASLLATCQLDLRNIAAALELYNEENMVYRPTDTWETDLTGGGTSARCRAHPLTKLRTRT